MKTIKFRGQLPSGKFVYGDLVQWGGYEEARICSWSDGVIYDIKPKSIAQFVGCDKDGKEIYEGDTLLDEAGRTFIVELKPHGCTFRDCEGRRAYSPVTFEMRGRNDICNFRVKSC